MVYNIIFKHVQYHKVFGITVSYRRLNLYFISIAIFCIHSSCDGSTPYLFISWS